MFGKVSLGILFVSRHFSSLSSSYQPLKTSRSLAQNVLHTTWHAPVNDCIKVGEDFRDKIHNVYSIFCAVCTWSIQLKYACRYLDNSTFQYPQTRNDKVRERISMPYHRFLKPICKFLQSYFNFSFPIPRIFKFHYVITTEQTGVSLKQLRSLNQNLKKHRKRTMYAGSVFLLYLLLPQTFHCTYLIITYFRET